MQAQNSKVVCPLCEKENDCTPPKAGGTAQKH